MSRCISLVRTKELCSHWTNLLEFVGGMLFKLVYILLFWLKSGRNNGQLYRKARMSIKMAYLYVSYSPDNFTAMSTK
jgi:hypothetical protein